MSYLAEKLLFVKFVVNSEWLGIVLDVYGSVHRNINLTERTN